MKKSSCRVIETSSVVGLEGTISIENKGLSVGSEVGVVGTVKYSKVLEVLKVV